MLDSTWSWWGWALWLENSKCRNEQDKQWLTRVSKNRVVTTTGQDTSKAKTNKLMLECIAASSDQVNDVDLE